MPAKRGAAPEKATSRVRTPASSSSPARGAKSSRTSAPNVTQGPGLSPMVVTAGACAVLAFGLVVFLATGGRAARIAHGAVSSVDQSFADMGFRLAAVQVQGASPMAAHDIIRATGLYKNQPTLGLDLQQVRDRVLSVGWVKDVRVVRLLPDTIVVAVKERRPTAVWQHAGRTVVIDGEGGVIAEADPARFPQLPLVVGQGADTAAPQILPAVSQRPRLMDRMEALIRVDDRRWDLRLKDGSIVQLPAIDADSALFGFRQN